MNLNFHPVNLIKTVLLTNANLPSPMFTLKICFAVLAIDFICILLTFPILKILEYFFFYNSKVVLKILSFIEMIIGLIACICFVYFSLLL